MQKTILITGSTDGIGLQTARRLVSEGHHILLHGRNPSKTEEVTKALSGLPGGGTVTSYLADLSRMNEVETLADSVIRKVDGGPTRLDVLINNAGVYKASDPKTKDGFEVRFAVNTMAPYLLTRRLLSSLGTTGRVINLSSAAQAPVDLEALAGRVQLSDSAAYAQSKLALTMWSRSLALRLGNGGPTIVAVNPGSFLGTKMVQQAYGMAGGDIGIGAAILHQAALAEEFAAASGQYYDNDAGRFAPPHPDALDPRKCQEVVREIEGVLSALGHEIPD